jgi:hypothetical protein
MWQELFRRVDWNGALLWFPRSQGPRATGILMKESYDRFGGDVYPNPAAITTPQSLQYVTQALDRIGHSVFSWLDAGYRLHVSTSSPRISREAGQRLSLGSS